MGGILPWLQFGMGTIADIFKGGWGMYAQKKTWEREDTAVQRRVEDMKAAGINPVLAAGSAAQAGSPVTFGSPEGDAVSKAMAVMKMRQDYSTTKAQEGYLRAQTSKVDEERKVLQATASNRILQSNLQAKFDQLMYPQKIQKYAAEANEAQAQSQIRILEAEFQHRYGDKRAAAESLLADIKAQVAEKYYLSQAEAELVALKLANEFMEKNIKWYLWNHTGGVIMQVMKQPGGQLFE